MARAVPSALFAAMAVVALVAPSPVRAELYERNVLAETATTLDDGGYAVDVLARMPGLSLSGLSGRDKLTEAVRSRASERAGEIARQLKAELRTDRLRIATGTLRLESLNVRPLGDGAYDVDPVRFRFTVIAHDE